MNYFLDVLLDNYANFKGRARRKEYWMFTLIASLISFVFGVLAAIFDTQKGGLPFYGGLAFFFALAILLPTLAVTARRLHDVGKSGWLQLLNFVPFANFYLLYLLVQEGEPSVNKWGPNPKDPLGSQYVSGGPVVANQDW